VYCGLSTSAQDTLTYYQSDAVLFSNQYTFYRQHRQDRFGDYEQSITTDDMQSWQAKGKFKEGLIYIHLRLSVSTLYSLGQSLSQHHLSLFKRKMLLLKTKRGLYTKGLWTKNRRSIFVKRRYNSKKWLVNSGDSQSSQRFQQRQLKVFSIAVLCL
jgi:hypothetical protein